MWQSAAFALVGALHSDGNVPEDADCGCTERQIARGA